MKSEEIKPKFRRRFSPGTISAWTAAALVVMAPATFARSLLFDFGADGTQTVAAGPTEPVTWNNVTSVGTDDAGFLPELLATDGTVTSVTFQMLSRFNGANENGTTTHPSYPVSATRDSLYGNTELFGDLENVTPIFQLQGLDSSLTYSLTFYASRTGVSDNRETRYTVTGSTELFADLNVANNLTNTATVNQMKPDGSGLITVALTPGPNNNNANHFTYLGILEIRSSTGQRILIDLGAGGTPTESSEAPRTAAWNNVTQTIGSDLAGVLSGAVDTNGLATEINLQIVSRFNGANSNGPTDAGIYPATATQDSLFGNTEAFSGLSDVLPAFKLSGLASNSVYAFTFYASRTGVSDNRETRYTVTGSTSATADLNAANNLTNRVTVSGIRPDAAGEIRIALTAGPNNNNANHFTYLGVLQVDEARVTTPRVLIDLGAAGRPTTSAVDPENAWNNVTTDVGSTDTGSVTNLLKTDGTASGITFQMISRFNGANENGTESSSLYPLDATRDSLYGNTEEFSGLADVTPTFKLTGLPTNTTYDLTLYASRLGVGDNRETRYTVTGATETIADLNVANNETETVVLTNLHASAAGELTVALSPGPNNDNGNHFTYLGVLQLDWAPAAVAERPQLLSPAYANGSFSFTLQGTAGQSYVIRRTRDFATWEDVRTVSLAGESQRIDVPQTDAFYFYQVTAP